MAIDIIRGSDRQFDLRITKSSNGDPKDLTGLTGTDLSLKLPGENTDLAITMTPNANGSKLELANAPGGRITVTLSDIDTLLLKVGDKLNMELTIKEGAGPDFDISLVQFAGQLNVKETLFPA